jgi:Cu/Ag efflux pump CusA
MLQAVATAMLVALTILPVLMHEVQTRTRLGASPTITRTVCKLGYQRRFRRLFAWLT